MLSIMTNRTLSLETLDGTSIRDFFANIYRVCVFTEKLGFYIYYMALLEMYKELGYSFLLNIGAAIWL